jgi:signal transduction histidine kinase
MVPLTAIVLEIAVAALAIRTATRWSPHVDWVGLSGLVIAIGGVVFVLGNLYAALPLYSGSRIPVTRGTGFCFTLLGLGLIAAAGPTGWLLRPLLGRSVQARLLRVFLPYAVLIVVGSDSLTLVAARLLSPSSSALTSSVSVALATALAVGLCVLLSGHIGGRLERAEAELREANELLETRVQERTRALNEAKEQLQDQNQELQQTAFELARSAEQVRRAHEDLQAAHDDLKRTEAQLVQSEKLSSLGQIVAGVAHEVNNPLAYVSNNVAILDRDLSQLCALIRLYRKTEAVLEEQQRDRLIPIRALAEEMDLDYVLENLPSMVDRSRAGLKRIGQIIGNLRDFARLDEAEIKEADLNVGVRSTLGILRGTADERGIALIEDLKPLRPLTCNPAKINQVVLNLVSNAIEASQRGSKVTISTRPEEQGGADLTITDSGHGIDPAIRGRIFDPFFTTKPVGKGAGLGLAISHGIIQAHGGTIRVESDPGRGSRFTVHIPDRPPEDLERGLAGSSLASPALLTPKGLATENE